MAQKIAYVMSRFPHLPETFILREMNALERQGWDIALYPLVRQRQAVIHAEAEVWLPRAHVIPFCSPGVLWANLKAWLRNPLHYTGLWAKVFWENHTSPKFLMRAMLLFPKAVFMAGQMQREGVAHLHAHYATHPALVAWIIHQFTGMSYSVTVHAHDIFVRKEMLKPKLGEAAFIVAISEFNRNYLIFHVDPSLSEKIQVIHCGIDPDQYSPRARVRQPEERLEIIHVGSLQPYKGQRYLIDACVILRGRRIPFRCRIVGEGGERPRLERLITAHHLENQVQLLGAQPQALVAKLLPTTHCYVQPSVVTVSGKMEGIPVALMEAMVSGLGVIATDISGIPELVRPGETGLLVPSRDAVALAGAIQSFYNDPEKAAEMATAGRDLVLREFELQTNVKKLAFLYRQLI